MLVQPTPTISYRTHPVQPYGTVLPYTTQQYVGRSFLPVSAHQHQPYIHPVPVQHQPIYQPIVQHPVAQHPTPQINVHTARVLPHQSGVTTAITSTSPVSSVTIPNDGTNDADLSPAQSSHALHSVKQDSGKRKMSTQAMDNRSIRKAKHREVEIRRRVKLAALVNELTDVLGIGAVDKCTLLAEAIRVIRQQNGMSPKQASNTHNQHIPSDTDTS